MCKHVLNAQVSIRAQCCKKWFDCAECHSDQSDHPIAKTEEMVFACKKCKKVFRKVINEDFDESDEYCPHCDNHYYIDAKKPEKKLVVEMKGVDNDMLDPRMKFRNKLFDIDDDDI